MIFSDLSSSSASGTLDFHHRASLVNLITASDGHRGKPYRRCLDQNPELDAVNLGTRNSQCHEPYHWSERNSMLQTLSPVEERNPELSMSELSMSELSMSEYREFFSSKTMCFKFVIEVGKFVLIFLWLALFFKICSRHFRTWQSFWGLLYKLMFTFTFVVYLL